MYWIYLAAFSLTYLGHYLHHGYDLVELVSYVAGVSVIVFLAYQERRDR